MKIFSAKQLMEADLFTLEKQGISSEELMERAAILVFKEIERLLKQERRPVKIFCGVGNNGGDGLVVARLLLEKAYDVAVYVVNYSDNKSKDFLLNETRLKEVGNNELIILRPEKAFPVLHKKDLVVDAIFGIGLNRPLDTWVANLIKHLNESDAMLISVDVPSGLFTDSVTIYKDAVVKADYTFSFQAPKLVFFLPQTGVFTGKLKILDIGLDRDFLETLPVGAHFIEKEEALKLYRPRKKFSHKGTFGHVLLVGGSHGKMGSICLTGTAALRAGAGMATFFIPGCGYEIAQTLLPEAMVLTDEAEKHLSNIDFDIDPSVVCFGVGTGQKKETLNAFEKLLDKIKKPMVIDADGLNLLSHNKELLKKIPKNSVLTPHPKELERLIGAWEDDFEKLEKAREFVKTFSLILVIKGVHSITVSEKGSMINSTGNPGMATAGSGDVLAGVITGLISQQYDPLAAAVLGVYLHGKAGDIAAGKTGCETMIAGDIAHNLGAAYEELKSIKPKLRIE